MNPKKRLRKLEMYRDELKALGAEWDALHAAIEADGRDPATGANAEETAKAARIRDREREIVAAGKKLGIQL